MKQVKTTKGKYLGPERTPNPAPTSAGGKKKAKVKRRSK